MAVEYQVLGPLGAAVDGRPADLGPPKQRAVLAVLLINANHLVPVDSMIDQVWPNGAPRTANHSIQLYVSELRSVLSNGGDPIETHRPGYLLRVPPGSTDAERFDTMVREGAALADAGRLDEAAIKLGAAACMWSVPYADFTYDDFARSEADRLAECHAVALERLSELELLRGNLQRALEVADELIDAEPLRERPRATRMRALHRLGRRPEALRTYRDYAELVGSELGVAPSSELGALEEEILLTDDLPAPIRPDGPPRNPFKGLHAFLEEDAADFFGRTDLIATMAAMVEAGDRLVTVVGPSGSGKSSVVRAGLVPRLRAQGGPALRVATMVPGKDPFESLASALPAAGVRGVMVDELRERPAHLLRLVTASTPGVDRVLLVIDQFEELFSMASASDQAAFLDLLAGVARPGSPIVTVLTLRADFYDKPLLHPGFAGTFTNSVVNVTPMTSAELRSAIVGPATAVRIGVDENLVTAIVGDMATDPGALALFQYALTEMFRTAGHLTISAYREVGGLSGALTRRAEDIFVSLDGAAQQVARQVILRLVTPGPAGFSRRRVPLRQLLDLEGRRSSVHEVLDVLTSHRLLTLDRDPVEGVATAQVAHEALLWRWDRLADWIEHSRRDIERHGKLTDATRDWIASGEDPAYFLTGTRLEEFEVWSTETAALLTNDERRLIDASALHRQGSEAAESDRREREAALERRARRRLWGLGLTTVLVVAALTFAFMVTRPEPSPEIALLVEQLGGEFEALVIETMEDRSNVGIRGVADRTVLDTMVEYADGGSQLLITTSQFGWAVFEVAPSYPDARFVILDSDVFDETLPNVTTVSYRDEEGSFLAGVVAAEMSETGRIGFIGGMETPIIFAFQAGYEAGATWARPGIQIERVYLSEFADLSGFGSPSLAGVVATGMFERGVDVLYTAAGDSALGSFEAARRFSETTGIHVWAIGVDLDQWKQVEALAAEWSESPWVPESRAVEAAAWQAYILTSMMKRFEVGAERVVELYEAGELAGGVISLGLEDGAVHLTSSGGNIDHLLPMIDDATAAIIAGELAVPVIPNWDYTQAFPRPAGEAELERQLWIDFMSG